MPGVRISGNELVDGPQVFAHEIGEHHQSHTYMVALKQPHPGGAEHADETLYQSSADLKSVRLESLLESLTKRSTDLQIKLQLQAAHAQACSRLSTDDIVSSTAGKVRLFSWTCKRSWMLLTRHSILLIPGCSGHEGIPYPTLKLISCHPHLCLSQGVQMDAPEHPSASQQTSSASASNAEVQDLDTWKHGVLAKELQQECASLTKQLKEAISQKIAAQDSRDEYRMRAEEAEAEVKVSTLYRYCAERLP